MKYDLIVLGGGPAGYVGAIRAAQLGKKVACVEMERAGGTCLNWGCIPTKALLKNAELYHLFKRANEFGFSVKDLQFDFAKVVERSRAVADRMAKGVEYLLKTKKVDYILGEGKITKDKKVIVSGKNGKQTLEAPAILLATGAVPRLLPGLEVDGTKILTSKEALKLKKQPKSIVILGAGAVGIEFAYFYNAFGTKVTLIEMLPRILPVEDAEVSALVQKAFEKDGIEVLTGTKVEGVQKTAKGITVKTSHQEHKSISADCLLVAIGVQANLNAALDKGVTLELDRGFVKTNERYETSVKGIYAAGDIIGPPWLAHVASHEAIEAVEGIFLQKTHLKEPRKYPGCTYCQPQVGSIGLTEEKAKEQGLKFKVGKFPYRASGRAVAAGEVEGFVKLIIDEKYGEILGAHIVGAEATEMIAELGMAISMEATVDEIMDTIHAHPTLSEMIAEASAASKNEAIHI